MQGEILIEVSSIGYPGVGGTNPSIPLSGVEVELIFFLDERMPANKFNGHADYGVGIGLRVPHYKHIFEKKPVVSWFEIISENFMVDGGRPLEASRKFWSDTA